MRELIPDSDKFEPAYITLGDNPKTVGIPRGKCSKCEKYVALYDEEVKKHFKDCFGKECK